MKQDEASSTARVIAASTLLLASDAKTAALVAPGAADLSRQFLSLSLGNRWLAWSATHPLTRLLWRALERMTYPGITTHYWHRKQWIETHCRSAIDAGFGRLVVIGAGFDTLGLRLAQEHRWLDVVEVDHPATQQVKRRALEASSILVPPNLRFETVDLTAAPLPTSSFADGAATLVVMEGVLMYLPVADVERVLDRLSAVAPARLRLVFSFMSKWPDGSSGFRPRSWLIERWMAWRGEPFKWAIEPEQVAGLLDAHRFRLQEMTLGSVIEGENLVVCDRYASHQ